MERRGCIVRIVHELIIDVVNDVAGYQSSSARVCVDSRLFL